MQNHYNRENSYRLTLNPSCRASHICATPCFAAVFEMELTMGAKKLVGLEVHLDGIRKANSKTMASVRTTDMHVVKIYD